MTEPIVDDPIAWCLADALAACFCAELAATSAPVGCCCVYPGEQVAVDSCKPGMAWVRIARQYPVGDRFPVAASAPDPCGGANGWAVVLELAALRCMPGVSAQGKPPPCGAVTPVARLVAADAQAMRRAVLCCDWRVTCGGDPDVAVVVGAWEPLGPQGLCVGGAMSVTVQSNGCVCGPRP